MHDYKRMLDRPNASQTGHDIAVHFSRQLLSAVDYIEIMKHLRRILVVNEKILAGVISLHQQLLMLLPLMMLWSSGDW